MENTGLSGVKVCTHDKNIKNPTNYRIEWWGLSSF
jgi:hypothetical protein